MGSIKYTIIDVLKTNRFGKLIYKSLKRHLANNGIKMSDLNDVIPEVEAGDEVRYNIVLPTLRKTKVFGGILTALKIFNLLLSYTSVNARIIVVLNEKYSFKHTFSVDGFGYGDKYDNQIVYLTQLEKLPVRKNDVFMFTNWRTAYLMMPVLNWQIKHYNLENRKVIYLIQDYEPGFFPWSTEYLLAESTYKTNPENIIALYNSKELCEFFKTKGYKFYEHYYFEPFLNEELKKCLLTSKNNERKKQILIYGRPSEHRNAFEIIKGALAIWSRQCPNAKEWSIISLGEDYENFKLENNEVKVLGKVSLKEYADILMTTYAGISLMVSPHPSYPPLEMSTFGVKTITNTFENKNLQYFNNNIISIENCSPREIANKLLEICDEFKVSESECNIDCDYVTCKNFDKIIKEIGIIVNEMVEKN